ncbi:MAG: 4Fe-4S dicluster domain-containing protein, partial [Anaerolineales bacterium]
LLRPCEVEAYYKISEAEITDEDKIVIFAADCLGTFPLDEFAWRAERKGGKESLTEEAFHFSKYGGIAPYRYRAACQLCKNPIANQADININIIGIPVRQQVVITTYNGMAEQLERSSLSTNFASPELIESHDATAQKLFYRNQKTSTRLKKALTENADLTLESLIDQLNNCEDCQACMEVCPMCTAFDFKRNANNRLDRDTVINWMLSCVGCGMCEQACTQHKPLAALFTVVNQQILLSVRHPVFAKLLCFSTARKKACEMDHQNMDRLWSNGIRPPAIRDSAAVEQISKSSTKEFHNLQPPAQLPD